VLRLGLSPDGLWRLSLAEWRWLLAASLGEAGEAGEAMDAAALKTLLKRYPDKTP